MKPAIEVFLGAPIDIESERRFLVRLIADLGSAGENALVFANFMAKGLQIDFLVVTRQTAGLVELKNYVGPLAGGVDGSWFAIAPDGSQRELERKNPYRQALDCKFALGDIMDTIGKQGLRLPGPTRNRFVSDLGAYVCIPDLNRSSSLKDDFKVRVVGYEELFKKLTTLGPRPNWTDEQWIAFGLKLGLFREADALADDPDAVNARLALTEYQTNVTSTPLHELIPLRTSSGDSLTAKSLLGLLAGSRSMYLVGRSGSGKSHLAYHAVRLLSNRGGMGIVVEANAYDGSLGRLLGRSVAPLTNRAADYLVWSAAKLNAEVLIAIDGINELPPKMRRRLLQEISAFARRKPISVLITTQPLHDLADAFDAPAIEVGELGTAERAAVLVSYGAEASDVGLCDAFETPYELAIAAECLAELAPGTSRSGLLDAYIRRRLVASPNAATARVGLRALAATLGERLTTAMPAGDGWRAIEMALRGELAGAGSVDTIRSCGLVRERAGRLGFSHELLGRFLEAESLWLKRLSDPSALGKQLAQPRNCDLVSLVLPLIPDAPRAREVLRHVPDDELLAEAMRGRLGPVAKAVAVSEASGALAEARFRLDDIQAEVNDVPMPAPIRLTSRIPWSDFEMAILTSIGRVLADGILLKEVVDLLDETDAACFRAARRRFGDGKQLSSSALVAELYVFHGSRKTDLGVQFVVQGCQQGRLVGRPSIRVDADISSLMKAASSTRYGVLNLLCLMFLNLVGRTSPEVGLLPKLLRLTWESGAYHLRLEGLHVTHLFASQLADSTRAEVKGFLASFETKDLGLSTSLIETMARYEMIEPIVSIGQVRDEIANCLSQPEDSEARQAAYSIVTNQLEELLSDEYFLGVEELDRADKVTLWTMAALGAPSYGFATDWILGQLLKWNDLATLPAFERWATSLDTSNPFAQGATLCYVRGVIGCAQFRDIPPQLAIKSDNNWLAWQHYGEIIFWLNRASITSTEVESRCEPVWATLHDRLLLAAVDPLFRFEQAGRTATDDSGTMHLQLARRFPGQLRRILEAALPRAQEFTSLFQYRDSGAVTRRLISLLGAVGDERTVALVEPYTGDPGLGASAIAAVRQLRERMKL
jgi:hypothetical protein